MSANTDVVTPCEHLLGRVKWFNNKAGYGFITVTDGPRSGSDIFVHHSAVNVENQQYKYLIQGEYVEFDLVRTESTNHEWQAAKVAGIRGGKLMCETRRESKIARSEYKSSRPTSDAPAEHRPRQKRVPSQRPRADESTHKETTTRDGDKKEWTLVAKSAPQKRRGRPPSKNVNATQST